MDFRRVARTAPPLPLTLCGSAIIAIIGYPALPPEVQSFYVGALGLFAFCCFGIALYAWRQRYRAALPETMAAPIDARMSGRNNDPSAMIIVKNTGTVLVQHYRVWGFVRVSSDLDNIALRGTPAETITEETLGSNVEVTYTVDRKSTRLNS